MKGRLLLDVVVTQCTAIFQLLASKNKTLLVRRDTFFVLDFLLDVLDRVGRVDFKGDGLASQSLDKDLHSTTQAKNEVEGGFLLDIVVTQGSAIFQLLASENETLLVRRDAFFVLDFLLDVLDRVSGVDFKGDSLASQSLDKDLHSTTQAKNEVKGRLLLDVVVTQGSAIFQLLASKNETLLVRRDTFFVLDFLLDVLDRVSRVNFKGDSFASQSLDKDLHSTTQAKNEVEGRFLLDIVVTQGSAIFQLLASKDQSLLVRRDAFFVLYLLLDVLDRVGGVDLKGDGLASQSLDKDLHSTTQAKNEVEGGFLLDIVVTQGSAIFQLLASKDQSLLVGRDAFFVLYLLLNVLDRVGGVDLKGDGLASQSLDEDLHNCESW